VSHTDDQLGSRKPLPAVVMQRLAAGILTFNDLLDHFTPSAGSGFNAEVKDCTGWEVELPSGWAARLDFRFPEWVLRFTRGSEVREMDPFASEHGLSASSMIQCFLPHAHALSPCS